jgi:glycosyltransferase involved in cell wall biosynthesis
MRIGIDGRPLVGRRTGIGRYVFEICRELDTLLPDAEFFVYAPEPVELPTTSPRWHCRTEPRRWARSLKPIVWLKLRAAQLCRDDHLDVFWASATLFPPLQTGVRRLTTVYDLTFRIAPDTMGHTHFIAHKLFLGTDVRRATQRTAISRGTAERLQTWLGGPLAVVIPPAVSPVFRQSDPASVAHTLTKFQVSHPYFLTVGTWEPRKNLELLIRVFRALQAERDFQGYSLVLAGGRGWKDQRLQDLLRSESPGGMSRNGINPLGFVTDEELAELYSGCRAFVFPSRYEGFGLPILEARACGANVVATDMPELREAGGDDAVYVEPTFAGLREGLRQVHMQPQKTAIAPDLLPTWRNSAYTLARCLRGESISTGSR